MGAYEQVGKPMTDAGDWVVFEQPLAERVRTYLRLEFLFHQFAHHQTDRSLWGARGAMQSLLDILSVLGRTDLRTDISKDLTEQHASLSRLVDQPQVDRNKLNAVLQELQTVNHNLHTGGSYPAAVLRSSDFLQSVHNRLAIPGGACTFDLPAYHRWLRRPLDDIDKDIDAWHSMVRPLYEGIEVLLRLLRESTLASEEVAENGMFLQQPDQVYHLLRIIVPSTHDVYPEISATRHRFSIRFMRLGDVNQRHSQAAEPVKFRMQCCTISPTG